jgi:hypothetical protein
MDTVDGSDHYERTSHGKFGSTRPEDHVLIVDRGITFSSYHCARH